VPATQIRSLWRSAIFFSSCGPIGEVVE